MWKSGQGSVQYYKDGTQYGASHRIRELVARAVCTVRLREGCRCGCGVGPVVRNRPGAATGTETGLSVPDGTVSGHSNWRECDESPFSCAASTSNKSLFRPRRCTSEFCPSGAPGKESRTRGPGEVGFHQALSASNVRLVNSTPVSRLLAVGHAAASSARR